MPKHPRTLISLFIVFASISIASCPGGGDSTLNLPFDHGPHFDVQNEWWYFTGDLRTQQGKRLGFQFTIFKRWQDEFDDFAYLGHLAISDPELSQHQYSETATLPPVAGVEEGKTEIEINRFLYRFTAGQGFVIRANGDGLAIDLTLVPMQPALPHGQNGILAMGEELFSHYYSYTDLDTSGTLTVNGAEFDVISGRSWMDHQWGDFPITDLRWDWFSLRLDDGAELMAYQVRDGFDRAFLTGWTYRSATGSVFYGQDVQIEAQRIFRDEECGCSYPVDWVVRIPELDARFDVRPLFDAQGMNDVLTPEYWEGLCSVEGEIQGDSNSGSAYVELTGYE